VNYSSLSAWQSALDSGSLSLAMDNPDINSISSNFNDLFIDA